MNRKWQTCPRRMAEAGPWRHRENLDRWRRSPVGDICSFCGSLEPERFLQRLHEGWYLGPTDKRYKAYLGPEVGTQHAKFYYQHFSLQQQEEFLALYNSGQMNIGYPYGLYVLPFFAKPASNE